MAAGTIRIAKLDRWLFWLGLLAVIGVAVPDPVTPILLLATTLWFCLVLSRERLPHYLRSVFLSFLAIGAVYLLSALYDGTYSGAKNVIGILVAFAFFFYFERLGRTSSASSITILYLLVMSLMAVALGDLQKNALSATACYLTLIAGVVALRNYRHPIFVTTITFIFVVIFALMMRHRTMQALGIAGWLSFMIMYFFPWRINRSFLLIGVVTAIVIFVALNVGLFGLDIRDYNQLVMEVTGRRALSGRQLIWPLLVDAVTSDDWRLWFGLGAGQTFSEIYDTHWSAHNYYLQTFMQTGLIGLGLLITLLYNLWSTIGRPLKAEPLSIFLITLLAIVIGHAATAVFLLQTNLSVAVNVWAGLGLGLGFMNRARFTVASPDLTGVRYSTANSKVPGPVTSAI